MGVSKRVIQAERELYLDAQSALNELDSLLDVLSIKHGIGREELYATISAMFDDRVLQIWR